MSKTAQQAWIAGAIALFINLGVGYILYTAEYANILSTKQYQRADDIEHNRVTTALERCLAKAVINHADNWDRICKDGYGLGEGCGLPQDEFDRLAAGLSKDNATCRANHVYIVPQTVGPAMDNQGRLLLPQ